MSNPLLANPLVTVVVPTHNRAELLPAVLGAILRQVGVTVEVVVVDDGSTDRTPALLDGWDDNRLVVVRNTEAHGVAHARNRGLARARGDWVAFCDDDDQWAPDKLRAQLDACARSGSCWSCTSAVIVDEQGRIVGVERLDPHRDVAAALLERDVIPGGGSSVLVRSDVIRTVGGFDSTVAACADWDYWIRLSRQGAPAVVDRPLVAYRVAAGSVSHGMARMAAHQDELRRRLAPDREAPTREARAHDLAYRAERLLRGGARLTAARCFAALALAERRPQRLGAVVAAAAFPRWLQARHDEAGRRAIPETWWSELRWLPIAPEDHEADGPWGRRDSSAA